MLNTEQVQCSRNAADTKPSGKSSKNLAPVKFSVLTMLSKTTEKPEMSSKGFDKSKQEQPKLLELHGKAKPKPLTPSFKVCRQETLWWWRLWNLQQFLGCACSVPTKYLIPHSSDIYRQSIIYTFSWLITSVPVCAYHHIWPNMIQPTWWQPRHCPWETTWARHGQKWQHILNRRKTTRPWMYRAQVYIYL